MLTSPIVFNLILVLIVMGAGVMGFAILKTRKILQEFRSGTENRNWKILLSLMVFFLGGYSLAFYLIFARQLDWVPLLTGTIFLFGAAFVYFSVSVYHQTLQRLIYVALHDRLTDLPNRAQLLNRLKLAIDRRQRSENYRFAVLFLDIDRFKVINDSLGHLAGDELLIDIAGKLRKLARATDLVARLGGDEFVVLLEEINGIEGAVRFAERVAAALKSPILVQERTVVVTTSIGIVFGMSGYNSPAELLRDADIALYRAKANGRATYEIFDARMHTQALQRMNLENDLRRAIAREELVVYYQPIIDLNSGHLIGFEALARWHSPDRGIISPPDFISVAEETGLIEPLDRWVLRSACQQLARWQSQFPGRSHLKISVNLSNRILQETDLVETVERILRQTGLGADSLALEITEGTIVENVSAAIALLSELRARNVQIAIDDFGTGYSSLSYLCDLPIDILKIDRSFVSQMQKGNKNHKIVEAIVALGGQLNLETIAEGIETNQQLVWLNEMGCGYGQGYLFSKPLAPQSIATFLAEGPLSDDSTWPISDRCVSSTSAARL